MIRVVGCSKASGFSSSPAHRHYPPTRDLGRGPHFVDRLPAFPAARSFRLRAVSATPAHFVGSSAATSRRARCRARPLLVPRRPSPTATFEQSARKCHPPLCFFVVFCTLFVFVASYIHDIVFFGPCRLVVRTVSLTFMNEYSRVTFFLSLSLFYFLLCVGGGWGLIRSRGAWQNSLREKFYRLAER